MSEGDAGPPAKTVSLEDILDPSDRRIKEDMLRMILSYLNEEGLHTARLALQDEANVKAATARERHGDLRAVRKSMKDGDWPEVERLIQKLNIRNNKAFLYSVYKQQFLEMVDAGELQKAFAFLTKRLKPLENMQSSPDEFRDLCYLLTCKSVQDAPSFRNWEGIGPSRESLLERFQSMLEIETQDTQPTEQLPTGRLLTLMRQALAYQLEFSAHRPKALPKITTLLEDYATYVVPNSCKRVLEGHLGNVKCVEFIGEEGAYLASGSSDNTIRIWKTSDGTCGAVLQGHSSRVWDLSSSRDGAHLASASADGTVRLWDVRSHRPSSIATYALDQSDIYTVSHHPLQRHLVTGGYDKLVRLVDIGTGEVLKALAGHRAPVCSTIFNPYGNLVISSSKDHTVRFWDMTSGICVNSIGAHQHLGEITSIAISSNGQQLLTCCKDNSNRLWDLRMLTCKKRFKGHQNTSKNFIRAGFGAKTTVVGGSEDGIVYIWDTEKGQVLQKLRGHDGIVYETAWNTNQAVLASCSEDRTVRLWSYDEKKT